MTPLNITPFTTNRILETVANNNTTSFDIKRVCFVDTIASYGKQHGAIVAYADVSEADKVFEITDEILIETAVINNNTIQVSFLVSVGSAVQYDRVYLLNKTGDTLSGYTNKEIIVIDTATTSEKEIVLNLNMPISAEVSTDTSGCS